MKADPKTNLKTKLMLLTFPFLLISCIEIRDPKKQAQNTEVVAPVEQPTVEVRPLDRPQQYAVVIKGVPPMSQVTRKPTSLLKEMAMTQVPVLSSQAEDIVDQPGSYEYLVQQNGQTINLPVHIPQDYVIEGDKTLDQLDLNMRQESDHFRTLETDGRIFFLAGATLTTNGENLLLKATSIDSEGAMIQTFAAHQQAAAGVPGRHGGDIKLEAQSLRGTLNFNMRGENGGRGETFGLGNPKPPQSLNNMGQKGGNSGLLELAVADKSRGGVTFNLEPGTGGEGTSVIVPCFLEHCSPSVVKSKGQDGLPGVAQQPMGLK